MRIEFYVSGSERAGLGHALRAATVISALPPDVDVSVRFSGDAYAESRLRSRLARPCTVHSAGDPAGSAPDATVLDSIDDAMFAAVVDRNGGRLVSLVHVPPRFRAAIDLLVLRAVPPELDGYRGTVLCGARYAAVDPTLCRRDAHARPTGTRSVGVLVTGAHEHTAARQLRNAVEAAASRERGISFVMPAQHDADPWTALRCTDVVLTGPGIAAFECAFVGVPAVYWCFDGVTWTVDELAAAGLGRVATGDAADAVRFAAAAADGGGLDVSTAGALVDGRGAARVAALIAGSD